VLDAELIVELDSLEDLYAEWDALAVANGLAQMSPAWILSWWRHLAPPHAVPRTVIVRDRERLVGLAPFYIQERRRGRVDYRLPGIELAARLAPLAAANREWDVAEAIGRTLAQATPRPDLIALEGAPLASHWGVALRDRWSGPIRPILRQYSVHGCPTISLHEASFDEWFDGKSSNFRGQMRRFRRQFLAAGGTERSSCAETLRSDIETFTRLHTSRWQGRGESKLVGFGDRLTPMLEDAGRRLVESERFRLRLLEVKGEPICAQLYLAAGERVLYFNSGWDERFGHFRPTMIGMLGFIADAFARGERQIDLGLGEQAYKLRFADGDDPVAWNMLMAPSRRLGLTYARSAPTLATSHLREAARRGLPQRHADRLRDLRSRLHRSQTPR
jgi:CelD/BcsL family acetyltransferase involved in cellulose biosynthesis